MVCVDPGTHCKLHGDVHPVLSTVNASPAGALVTVIATVVPNVAVTVVAADIVTFCGVVVPLSAPVNPVNWYPAFAVALTDTTVPALYHPLDGAIVPPADGLADVVRKYCVV
jgi:hypothetical protein